VLKPIDLTVDESIDDDDFLAAPELKEAVDAVRADLDDWTKLQDLIVHHWSSGVRQCARNVLKAATDISQTIDAIDRHRERHAQRIAAYGERS